MKHFALYFGIAAALVASCSIQEEDFKTPLQDNVVYYASFEQPALDGTRVYANEDLLLRWTADDRVSIFNNITYNQEYRFTGQTGANAGGFKKVDNDEFVTGNAISHVVSVYPYQESTTISESEEIYLMLPAEQHYAENTFGLGDNAMVSVSADNVLQYKSVGGFLRLSLYGDGVTVSSITLKGNNGEKLAGKATVTMPLDGTPTATLAEDAVDKISLVCDTPVALGATAEESKDFWLVVPPVTFSKGFTVTVSGNGCFFEKSTEKTVTIERNKLSKMAPIEVELTPTQPRNVIYYTSTDGTVVKPYQNNVFGAKILSNEYVDGLGIITFDGDVTSIGELAFQNCRRFTSITIPGSVTSIGMRAFSSCTSLTSITIPGSVTSIGMQAFNVCTSLTSVSLSDGLTSIGGSAFYNTSLTSITIPGSVTSIGDHAFWMCTGLASVSLSDGLTSIGKSAFSECKSLSSITIPGSVTSIGDSAFYMCTSLSSITIPNSLTSIGNYAFYNCTSLTGITIPGSVTTIGMSAFSGCTSLTSITIPDSVTSIGVYAFSGCTSLTSITVESVVPPSVGWGMFDETDNCPIYVPAESVELYKSATCWSEYADRIYAIGTPVAVDLGLPSGLKWASFNLGASKPEEYGDYYAWGEIEPYYSSLDPLTWKEGKEDGYNWSSYKWCMGSDKTLTKYCSNSSYGYNGFTDTKTVLDLEDDAASVNLGGNWRMPTDTDWTELRENCIWTWTTQNGVTGRLVTASNGNSIFFPAAGYRYDTYLGYAVSDGYYWSSSLITGDPYRTWYIGFDSGGIRRYGFYRYFGLSVRPVTE